MVVILHVNIIVWYIDIIVYYYYIDITKLVSLTLQCVDIYWLVVWNMHFIFHNIWGNPSHWLSFFFKMVETTSQIHSFYLYIYFCIHHQYIYIYIYWKRMCPEKLGSIHWSFNVLFFQVKPATRIPPFLADIPRAAASRKPRKSVISMPWKSMFLMGYNDQK